MALVQGLASTPLALSDDARTSIGYIEDSTTRPGTPLSPEPARVVRVFTRRKLGEVERTADQAIVVSVEKILHFQNMSLKDASKELGLSTTAFKGVCRRLGIMAWPFKTAKDTRNVKRARASATPDDSDTAAPKTPPSAFPTPPPSPTPPHRKWRKSMQSPPLSEVSTPQSYKSIEHNRLPPAVLRLPPPARPSTATPAHPPFHRPPSPPAHPSMATPAHTPFHRPPSPRALGAHVLQGWVSKDAHPSMATPTPAGAVRGFPVASQAAACVYLEPGACDARGGGCDAYSALNGSDAAYSAHHGRQAAVCDAYDRAHLGSFFGSLYVGASQAGACDARGGGCDAEDPLCDAYGALNGSDAAYGPPHLSHAAACDAYDPPHPASLLASLFGPGAAPGGIFEPLALESLEPLADFEPLADPAGCFGAGSLGTPERYPGALLALLNPSPLVLGVEGLVPEDAPWATDRGFLL